MKRFSDENGSILVLFAILLVVLIGMAALAIDVGYIATAKHQLQNAVDSAALAGASGLLIDQNEATNRAIQFAGLNDCVQQPVSISGANITFPLSYRIHVQTSTDVPLFFARIFGMQTATVSAAATAELGNLNGTRGLRPWAIPDTTFVEGQLVTLKSGVLGAPATNPSFFYPVDLPPLNRGTPIPGADAYADNVAYGSDEMIYIGDQLQVEPGNMIGPTRQGVTEILSQDPDATWDTNTGTIDGSSYPGFSSPRIVVVAIYDRDLPPDSGRNYVEIIDLAAFFIEGMQGQDVIGRYVDITKIGDLGGGSSMLYGVKLVE